MLWLMQVKDIVHYSLKGAIITKEIISKVRARYIILLIFSFILLLFGIYSLVFFQTKTLLIDRSEAAPESVDMVLNFLDEKDIDISLYTRSFSPPEKIYINKSDYPIVLKFMEENKLSLS